MTARAVLDWLFELIRAAAVPVLAEARPLDGPEAIEVLLGGRRYRISVEELS